jgi:hypothetical protein
MVFRDARPFNPGETHSDLKSLFPPFGLTVVGAIPASPRRNSFPAPLHLLGQPTKEEGEQWSQITKLRLEKVLIVT